MEGEAGTEEKPNKKISSEQEKAETANARRDDDNKQKMQQKRTDNMGWLKASGLEGGVRVAERYGSSHFFIPSD